MKVSYQWLKDYLPISDIDVPTIAKTLTQIGLEVEEIHEYTSIPGNLEGLVVGQVIQCVQHPNADKLKLCQVDIGNEILQIVCGAANVAKGQKVVVATMGSTIYPTQGEPIKIKKSKIRGEESNGMICAEDEIGIGTSHEGIIVLPDSCVVGTPVSQVLSVYKDTVFTLGITPNRNDALGHLGVARDIAAALQIPLNIPKFKPIESKVPIRVLAYLHDPQACLRYSTIELYDITLQPSPEWIQHRLKAIGIKPKNNIVDATNYVMYALGQPLHAFDIEQIQGQEIHVKVLTKTEKFVTLDYQEINLPENTLSISDTQQTLCIAGIFGGAKSSVKETTTKVLLESAYFAPLYIRKSSKSLNLHTDAAYRFARSTDINSTLSALELAVQIIQETCPNVVCSQIQDIYPNPVQPHKIFYRFEKAHQVIGTNIPADRTEKILQILGFEIIYKNEQSLTLLSPTFKADVSREIDVIEEVARIYGLDNIPLPEYTRTTYVHSPKPDTKKMELELSQYLVGLGLQEVKHLSFTHKKFVEEETAVAILEPLSEELSHLRQTLLFGGLQSIAYNLNRKQNNLQFFEFGQIYFKQVKENTIQYTEKPVLGIWLTGQFIRSNWNQKGVKHDFFSAKSIANSILRYIGYSHEFEGQVTHRRGLSQVLEMLYNQQRFIIVGKVAQEVLQQFDIKQDVYYVGLQLEPLYQIWHQRKIRYQEVSKFPVVKRDIALLLDKKTTYQQLKEVILNFDKRLIQSVEIFDVYEGENIPKGKKSYAITLVLQDKNRTLQDDFIEKWVGRLEKVIFDSFGAVLRRE
ncbi:MAG: phenylalanine--tRNA ligase subunit beta [Bacteroidia bacterium]|nr:phenylalanine--tRNA ligase subunit beta [Bacteroidia bacterium]MDW8346269.1 phenylalanine--tRNA ligase subunit beta [Bacteroidia bacterium]